MISDELNIKQFIGRTKGMDSEERLRTAEQEVREIQKIPYFRQKGATKTKDQKIEQYLAQVKGWINENYYTPQNK
jgi:hypothetical protein